MDDLDEWEVLPDVEMKKDEESNSVLEMNYFIICPPPKQIPPPKMETHEFVDIPVPPAPPQIEEGEFDSEEDNNVWKRRISSFGMAAAAAAAAAFCFLVFTHHNNTPKQQLNRFQIYSPHKVIQQASKLNELAMSRARITWGGYYDAPSL